jgi:hypothetical protein
LDGEAPIASRTAQIEMGRAAASRRHTREGPQRENSSGGTRRAGKLPKCCSSCAVLGRLHVGICLMLIARRDVGRICATLLCGEPLSLTLAVRAPSDEGGAQAPDARHIAGLKQMGDEVWGRSQLLATRNRRTSCEGPQRTHRRFGLKTCCSPAVPNISGFVPNARPMRS